MRNTKYQWLILDLIFLIVFNIIFFLIGGTEHNLSVWISYAFIHIAYIMLLLTPLFTAKSYSSYVFGATLGSISFTYFFIVFITALIFIFWQPENWKMPFIIQLVIASIYAIVLISNMIANQHTADDEIKTKDELDYIKTTTNQLSVIMDSTNNKQFKKHVEKIYDDLKSSPIKSHPSVASIEGDIQIEIQLIDAAMKQNDESSLMQHINIVKNKIAERNNLLLMLN